LDFIYAEKDDLLGEGQGGRVYRVRYNGADIAIKFIIIADEKQADVEFKHEVNIMQHIPPHPNVVGFLGGSLSKPHFLAITLMRGSLETLLLINNESPIDFVKAKTDADVANTSLRSLKDILWYLVGASAGLLQLDAHGVVHGDVAARNLLVDFNNNCCLCDFGMSQLLPEGETSVETPKTKIPIAWCAPETLSKHQWSPKTDVYSFGMVIVEIMTRNAPFVGENLKEIVPRICDARKRYRPYIADWWPSDLADLATDCVAHRAGDRPTMMAVNTRLYRFHSRLCKAQSLWDVYPSKPTKDAMSLGAYKPIPSSQYYLDC